MNKKKIGIITEIVVAITTVVLVLAFAGCGNKDAEKTEVTDTNGNVVTSVNKGIPAQTDKNGKIINDKNSKTKTKPDVNVSDADKSNGDNIKDLVNDKKSNKSSKKNKASKNGKSNSNSKKNSKKKSDKKDGKRGNFDVKDHDDEPGFGPLIDG